MRVFWLNFFVCNFEDFFVCTVWLVVYSELYIKLDSFSDTSNKVSGDFEMEVDQYDSSSLDISSVDFQQANDDNSTVHER